MYLNNTSCNHFMYADGAVLLTPSACGLQHMITICEVYANDCAIIFNLKKCVHMCTDSKCVHMCTDSKRVIEKDVMQFRNDCKNA